MEIFRFFKFIKKCKHSQKKKSSQVLWDWSLLPPRLCVDRPGDRCQLSMIEETTLRADTTKRAFCIKNNISRDETYIDEHENRTKNVSQLHYVGWPDFGVPEPPQTLVRYSLVKITCICLCWPNSWHDHPNEDMIIVARVMSAVSVAFSCNDIVSVT